MAKARNFWSQTNNYSKNFKTTSTANTVPRPNCSNVHPSPLPFTKSGTKGFYFGTSVVVHGGSVVEARLFQKQNPVLPV